MTTTFEADNSTGLSEQSLEGYEVQEYKSVYDFEHTSRRNKVTSYISLKIAQRMNLRIERIHILYGNEENEKSEILGQVKVVSFTTINDAQVFLRDIEPIMPIKRFYIESQRADNVMDLEA